MEFKNGQKVQYTLMDGVNGVGIIQGKATVEQPVIGANYILRDASRFPSELYPFECFACFECMLKPIE